METAVSSRSPKKVSNPDNAPVWLSLYNGDMPKTPRPRKIRWFIAEWREYRKLSQEQVADRLNSNKGQISKLETGKQRMNDSWIEGFAKVFGIAPGRLLSPPDAPTADDLLAGVNADQLKTIRRTVAMMVGKSEP
jgi:DNA-binding XRE family transcriptional regulator